MSRSALRAYFDGIEQQLLTLSDLYVERFDVAILTAEQANLKLRLRFKGRYLLALSEALQVAEGQIMQIDYRYHFQHENN